MYAGGNAFPLLVILPLFAISLHAALIRKDPACGWAQWAHAPRHRVTTCCAHSSPQTDLAVSVPPVFPKQTTPASSPSRIKPTQRSVDPIVFNHSYFRIICLAFSYEISTTTAFSNPTTGRGSLRASFSRILLCHAFIATPSEQLQ